jgi:hypothetical protein
MPKLPDVISGVPQEEPMYSRQPVVQAREVTAPIGHAYENFGQAIGQAGQAIAKYSGEQDKQQETLDLIRADATHQAQLNNLSRSFDADTDYPTKQKRFQDAADAQLTQNAAGIQDPQARALWAARAAAANQQHSFQVGRGADAMDKQGKAVNLTGSLDQYRDTLLDPNASDAQRAQAMQGINDSIAISQHAGVVDPRTADALRTKYLYEAPREAAANMIDRDSAGFKQKYWQAAPQQNAQAVETPGTEAKPIGGRLLPSAQAPAGNPVAGSVVDELRTGGASDNAIRGILANIKDESNFNPAAHQSDQPNWTGEAHYAHGLYQAGGAEWNNYAAWLKENHPDANWQDPKLQTQFLVQNLQRNYPDVWRKMNEGTPEQAAQAFVSGYLKPAAGPMQERTQRYGQGIPEIDALTGGGASGKLNLPSWASSLSPLDKQQLIDRMHVNIAKRNSDAAVAMDAEIDSDTKRLAATGEIFRDADGKTSLDRAAAMGLPVEKLRRAWNAAQLSHDITHDLADLPEDQATARIEQLSKLAKNPDADFAAIEDVGNQAAKQLREILELRAREPAAAADDSREVAALRSNPPLVQRLDGTSAVDRPAYLQALAQARLAAQSRIGIEPGSQRIVNRADADWLLGLGGQKPKGMDSMEFMDKMDEAAVRAKQYYGPQLAQRAMKEAIGYMAADQEHRNTANDSAAKLILGGTLNNDDILALRNAQALDPMASLVRSVSPRADKTLATPSHAAPQLAPNKAQISDLQQNPDQWAVFDRKFGAGASAHVLGFDEKGKPIAPPPGFAAGPTMPASATTAPLLQRLGVIGNENETTLRTGYAPVKPRAGLPGAMAEQGVE